jgi:tetratricopeptide (TPR) repeat protein
VLVLLNLNRTVEALAYIEEVIRYNPKKSYIKGNGFRKLAICLIHLSKNEEAIKVLDNCLRSDLKNVIAWAYKGYFLLRF